MTRKLLFFALIFVAHLNLSASEVKKDSIFVIKDDDLVLSMIDSTMSSLLNNSYVFNYDTSLVYMLDSIKVVSQVDIECALEELNALSPFDLRYNQYVEAFINLYVVKKRELSSSVISLAPYYYPMIESALDRYNLPLELKHLAVVESALNPSARSRVGAQGLWQFMYGTAKMFGLQMNSYYDERLDPVLATEAACKYLSHLYGIYGDWSLVLAAYNSGPGNVNKAIRRSGGKKNYWEIRSFLPRETRGYVPAFIAVNYMMNNSKKHNIYPRTLNNFAFQVDTIRISYPFNFNQLSEYLGISVDVIKELNPQYRLGQIPNDGKLKTLCLPNKYIGMYLTNENSIFEDIRLKSIQKEVDPKNVILEEPMFVEHRVRSGEFLGYIANKYNCRVSDLMAWNNLRSTRINPGDVLIIKSSIVSNREASSVVKKAITQQKIETENSKNNKYQVHVVRSGDTLWDIAKLYGNTSVTDLKRLNSNLNFKRLKPGTEVKVKEIG